MWGTCSQTLCRRVAWRFIPTCVGNIPLGSPPRCLLTVHPHVCGEHSGFDFEGFVKGGSSPRVWGTCAPSARRWRAIRFIPTCVGNMFIFGSSLTHDNRFIPTCVGNIRSATFRLFTSFGSSPRVWGTCRAAHCGSGRGTVHPHVCGEHSRARAGSPNSHGSSPRVWGTCPPPTTSPQTISVHPHVCGEHEVARRRATADVGSSPRVWGTCRAWRSSAASSRFIPTCVGNIKSSFCPSFTSSVHPHVCGEHGPCCQFCGNHCGSSPRVWGTSSWLERKTAEYRFIPTCVGNMQRSLRERFLTGGSSPRVWGTFRLRERTTAGRLGSSPRVWGTCQACAKPIRARSVHPHVCGEHQPTAGVTRPPIRFIPTCVGNIVMVMARRIANAVHPHVCGEHGVDLPSPYTSNGSSPRVWGTCIASWRPPKTDNGSSPRVWGTLNSRTTRAAERRFIPTCVGNMR